MKTLCTDKTGRAEGADVQYDPSHVSYEELLDIFWRSIIQQHIIGKDPTSEHNLDLRYSFTIKNIPKQGEERVDRSGKFGKRQIFAEIKPASRFYNAVEYHQQYFQKYRPLR
jgi:peptide-methionine (S)-S-oxide reductase